MVPFPQPHENLATPAPSRALDTLRDMANTPAPPAVPSAPSLEAEYWAKEGQTPFTSLEKFILGTQHGAATVGAQAMSLKDRLLGQVTKEQELPDWQAEHEVPQEVQQSPEYKAGDVTGQVGTYGAGSLAGATGVAATGAGIPAVAATAAATGAAENAVAGMGAAAREAVRKGKKASVGDLAGSAALGAGFSAIGSAAAPVVGKALGSAARNVISRGQDLAKRLGFDPHKFVADIESQIIKSEAASLAKAQQALQAATAPTTAIGRKQIEILRGLDRELPTPGEQAYLSNIGKQPLPKLKVKDGQIVKPQAPAPQVRGVVQRRGYQRAYNGTPLERVMKKLSPEMAAQLKGAVEEIGETAAAVQHLKNQVAAYAENALKLASTPADLRRVNKEVTKELTTTAGGTLSKVRAYLFEQQHKLQAMTHPLRDLELSSKKHLNVTADRKALKTELEPLADTFTEAAKQAETANGLLLNAEKHLKTLRERHQPLFEQMDAHIGTPTAVRHVIQNEKFGPSSTHMTVQLQYNPSVAHLAGRYLARYKEIEQGIRAVERNLKEKVAYDVAHNGRVTAPAALKALSKAGIIHPTSKTLLLAAALGVNAFGGAPAHAAGLDDNNTPEQNIWDQAKLPLVVAGAILAKKFGPAGARYIASHYSFIFHFLYEDTQELSRMADDMMANFRGGTPLTEVESLGDALNEYRGKLFQAHLLPDAHGAMARALQGDPDALAVLTPQGRKFAAEVSQLRDDIATHVAQYRREFDEGYHALSKADQLNTLEIRNAVHNADKAFNGKAEPMTAADYILHQVFHRAAAFNFTLNWKIATVAWLHDMAAYGGMQVGVPSVYAAYGQFAGSPILRGLVQRLDIGGAATEVAQELDQKANPFGVELVHNQLATLAALNKYYQNSSPEQLQHMGVTSATDFAEKALSHKLPDVHADKLWSEVALDVARMTGSDPSGLNKLGWERSLKGATIFKYTRYMMIEQRLIKLNLQMAAQFYNEGKFALALQLLGRIAHALAVKAQYGGARALIPVTAYGALMSSQYTAQATAQVADAIDSLSLGLRTLGNLGEHGRWDPIIAPIMGQRTPGIDDAIEAFKDVMSGGASISKMTEALGSGDPTTFTTGSKADADVKKGQNALVASISAVGLLFPKLQVFGASIPTRWVRDAVKYWPDVANKEFTVRQESPWGGLGRSMVTPSKVVEYEPLPGQTQAAADAEAQTDALLELAARTPGVRPRAFQQAVYAANAANKLGATAPEPLDAASLAQK
jgi:hypothetical protein